MIYEYAGFLYNVVHDEDGYIRMVAVPGQHKAAYKHKHLKNARSMFMEECGEKYDKH